jgi:hypothetical protein
MIKWIVCTVLAHILMPFIVTTLSIVLIEYWSQTILNISPLTVGAESEGLWKSVALVFWVVFILSHLKFAVDWWWVRDLEVNET